MKLIINRATIKRAKELTNKEVVEIKIIDNGQIVANTIESKDLSPGIYCFDVVLEYKDGLLDELENQKIEIKDKDKQIILGYAEVKNLIIAILLNPLFWLGVVLSTLIAAILGSAGIFLYAVCATFAMNNSILYKRKGIEIFKLK